jgi:ribosomal protein S18 acetylase RimI-like enzyme
VRAATAADVAGCLSVAVAGGLEAEAMRQRFEKDLGLDERGLFVALAEGRIVGYGRVGYFEPPPDAPANCAPEGYYMGGLLVDSGCRRRGLGRALTAARLAWAFERAPEAWYFTNARNAGSLALHEELGFALVTRDFVFPGVVRRWRRRPWTGSPGLSLARGFR